MISSYISFSKKTYNKQITNNTIRSRKNNKKISVINKTMLTNEEIKANTLSI